MCIQCYAIRDAHIDIIAWLSKWISYSKPSLVCDFQEIYRHLIDDFVIEFSRKLRKRNFRTKTADFSSKKKGKREYLDDVTTKELIHSLNMYFKKEVDHLLEEVREWDEQVLKDPSAKSKRRAARLPW